VIEQTEFRLAVSRDIAAPAAAIFRLLASPAGQRRIDGSEMLVGQTNEEPLRAIGDVFGMDMDREPLGDFPMGKYHVENVVTRFAQDSGIEWSPYMVGDTPAGYVWGWALVETDGVTRVTNYCDWTVLRTDWRDQLRWPIVPPEMIERSLDNLQRLVEQEQ
jgi:hypothetical protein